MYSSAAPLAQQLAASLTKVCSWPSAPPAHWNTGHSAHRPDGTSHECTHVCSHTCTHSCTALHMAPPSRTPTEPHGPCCHEAPLFMLLQNNAQHHACSSRWSRPLAGGFFSSKQQPPAPHPLLPPCPSHTAATETSMSADPQRASCTTPGLSISSGSTRGSACMSLMHTSAPGWLSSRPTCIRRQEQPQGAAQVSGGAIRAGCSYKSPTGHASYC